MRMNKLVCLITVGFLVSCASTPVVIAPFDKSLTVEKSFDEVWSTLVRFMSTNDVGIKTIEKESGLIQLEGENLSTQLIQNYCVTNSGMFTSVSSGRVDGSITVFDEDGFVTVNVNARHSFTLMNPLTNPPTYQTLSCEATGAFETAVLNSVR